MIYYNPSYNSVDLSKYRLTYSDPAGFMARYLYKRHNEEVTAWIDRRKLQHNPAFAREAVDEFARALIQRSTDIKRLGGHPLFQEQINGLNGGVDRKGNSMNAFLANYIIGELMAMGSVGIFVDNDPVTPLTAERETKPYIYSYTAENILNWHYEDNELKALLLRDSAPVIEDGLPIGYSFMYRKFIKTPDGILYTLMDDKESVIKGGVLSLKQIPFVHICIPFSLLRDTADYQITLLNLRSASTYQTWATNFPLFTRQTNAYEDFAKPKEEAKSIGTVTGYSYPVGTERPAWIHPSPEPLEIAMQKEEQLKMEIRQLTALAITTIGQRMVSAESKDKDREGMESGLSAIGLVLEAAETRLSEIWHDYKKTIPAQINYPEKYELLGEEARRANARELKELQYAVPSTTFQRETAKVIASVLHGHRVPYDVLQQMHKEIIASPVPTSDPEVLRSDHEAGFVSDETASVGRGYSATEALKAREDHALRIARIQAAQSPDGARGLKDLDTNPGNAGVVEKKIVQDPTKTNDGHRPVRGDA